MSTQDTFSICRNSYSLRHQDETEYLQMVIPTRTRITNRLYQAKYIPLHLQKLLMLH